VVTANRTWDGAVIYRTSQQGWSADLSDAAIVRSSDEARALLAESVATMSARSAPMSHRSKSRTPERSSPAICVNISGRKASPSTFRSGHKANG